MEEIHFLLGNSCNLNCDFCFWDKRIPLPPTEITKKILDEIIALGVKRVTISGGEPTCSPSLLEVVQALKDARIETVVHTNGLAVNEVMVNKLARFVDRISLSLDGSNSQIGFAMRKNNDYVPNTIKLMNTVLGLGMSISVKTLVTRVNYNDIVNIGNLLVDKTIKYWSLLEFNPINRGKIHKDKFYISAKEFDAVTKQAVNTFPTIDVRVRKLRREPEKYCFILSNGEVFTYDGEAEDKQIGDLQKTSLAEVIKAL
jgi:MoaA/NifB/PqqE/SkfB family radical SAM enzyme